MALGARPVDDPPRSLTTTTPPLPMEPIATRAAPDFVRVYEQEFTHVWNAVRRLGVPSRHVPDLTQDVFVTVYRRLNTYDPSRPLRPWLFGVAFRVVAAHLRRSGTRREVAQDDLDPPDHAPEAADEQLADRENRRLLAEALATLDLDHRAVLIAHDIDEHPAVEIAHALGIPLKTMHSRLRVARVDLAAAVRRLRLRRGER